MSKTVKPAASQTTDVQQPKKTKKKLILIIATAALLTGGGAAAFFLWKHPQAPKTGVAEEELHAEAMLKFVDLGTFTANLVHEEGDRYLQVGISLKLTRPELEEKVKQFIPEIAHNINMLLQSKRPSDLYTVEGKVRLASEIKTRVEIVIGLRKTAPEIHSEHREDASAPAATHEIARKGIEEVLFTSFIIQ